MLDLKQVQNAIKRIDDALSHVQGDRQVHLLLIKDLQLVQQCCKDYFDDEKELMEKKDVGTNEPTDGTEPGNPNI